jgi:hypothetical protein
MSFAAEDSNYSHGFMNEHLSASLGVPSMDEGGMMISGGRRSQAVPPAPANSRSYSQYDSNNNLISSDSLPQARRSSSLPVGPSHSFDGNIHQQQPQQHQQQQPYLSSSPGQSQRNRSSPAASSTFSPSRSKASSISSASGSGFPTASYENLSYSYDSPVQHRSYSNNSNLTPYEGRFSAINSPAYPPSSSLPLSQHSDLTNRDSLNSRHSRNPSGDSLTDALMMGNHNSNNTSNLGSSVPPVPSLIAVSSPISSSYFQHQQMNTPPPPGLIPNSSSASLAATNLSSPFASSNISNDL